MRVALVHDWLVSQRGGENVLLALASMFPQAPIYTLVHQQGGVHPDLEAHPIVTSFLQSRAGTQHFRRYLPLMFKAVEQWNFDAFDLVVSSSHCVAKGVRTKKAQVHVSYVHSPMRYLYEQMPDYLPQSLRVLAPVVRGFTWPLRYYDRQSANRPSTLIANSTCVSKRIAKHWGRSSQVVYPPVDVAYFGQAANVKRKGYLVVGALVAYKRFDIAVRWATEAHQPLTVVGVGPQLKRLMAMAGPTVQFVGHLDRPALRQAYAQAEALLFCGVEDFGIVPVEAMATGCPVIALGEGGALESVVDGVTGCFYTPSSQMALHGAVNRFETLGGVDFFDRQAMLRHAQGFRTAYFKQKMHKIIDLALQARQRA